jgi:hypothetical protein
MTAEIAILNKSAVALAADSAVTVGSKIYNSANKIFALSKHHPVAIMIYHTGSICGVPWETIIKSYRTFLGDTSFNTIAEYSESFFEFINNQIIPSEVERQYLKYVAFRFYQDLLSFCLVEIENIDDVVIRTQHVKKVIQTANEVINAGLLAIGRDAGDILVLKQEYSELFIEVINVVFNQYQLEEKDQECLILMGCRYMISDDFSFETTTGIIFAGFGDYEVFPSMYSYIVGGKFGYLKYKLEKIDQIDGLENNSSITPFAQSDMVIRYLVGLDPQLNQYTRERISGMLGSYNDLIFQMLSDLKLSKDDMEHTSEQLSKYAEQFVHSYDEGIREFQHENYIGPLHDIITNLPYDELAKLAEVLVSLSSYKNKLSKEQETVGGPIDVAIITKGDGLIWIKRKHYFNPEINTDYFHRAR